MLTPRFPLLLAALVLAPTLLPAVPTAAADVAAGSGPSTPQPPTFTTYSAPQETYFGSAFLGGDAAEPSIGVNWETGNVMFQSWATTLRVVFDDAAGTASWSDVSGSVNNLINVDPILFTDSVDGRTYAGGLNGECSILMYTDDDGQSWNPMTNACGQPGWDHETIGAGPWASPKPPQAVYDRAVYYCAQAWPAGTDHCSVSYDGGITFAPTVPIACGYTNPGLHGSVHVGQNGYAWLPVSNGGGTICVARSTNNGQTWAGIQIPGTTGHTVGFDPDVATTPGGRVYVGLANADGSARVAVSDNHGTTWRVSPDLGAPLGVKVTTFHEMVAGDDNRAAVAFLGTKDTTSMVTAHSDNAWTGIWHLYVAYTYDGGLTWTTYQVSTDPVQRGCIWDAGGDNACRNLLDFMDAQVDQEGRVLVGYADGCRGACAQPGGTVAQSRSAWGTISRQTGGRTLFSEFDDDGASPLAAVAGGPYTGSAGSSIAVGGAATGGTAPYAYAWSVLAKPAGSAAGSASFANPNAASTVFTPDAAGVYTLRLLVTDASTTSVAATAVLTALGEGMVACAPGGVVVGSDTSKDAVLSTGDASEAHCLRFSDDAEHLDVYVDLAGEGTSGPLYYDVLFTATHAQNARFMLEGTWDGAEATAALYEPESYLPIAAVTVDAEMVDSTFHMRIKRSDLLSPPDGTPLTGVYLDVNYCAGGATPCDLKHTDYVPDSLDAQYVLGSAGGSGGGIPLPECSVVVHDDPDTDAGAAAVGLRELVLFSASDTDDDVTFCFDVLDFSSRPTGTGGGAQTVFEVDLTATYEEPLQPLYFAQVTVSPSGAITGSSLYRGAVAAGQFVTDVPSEWVGNRLKVHIGKAYIGAPRDGDVATNVRAFVSDEATQARTWDSTPTGFGFEFGQKLTDVTPPAQVTGLAVSDPRTGSSLALAWAPATDDVGVVSYVVNRSTTPGGPYATVATPSAASYSDGGLAQGTTYYYTVSAVDAAGNVGPASAEASGIPTPPDPDLTPPSPPTDLVVSGTETDRISITWSASVDDESPVVSYRVWRDGEFAGSTVGTTFTDIALQPETTYEYTVTAINSQGLESAPAGIFATTLPLPPPDCGQTGYELFTDPDFDSRNGQRRADIVRVSLREADGRVWFHVGSRNMTGPQEHTIYRVVLVHQGTTYAVQGSVADSGTISWGVYTTVVLPTGEVASPRTSSDVVVQRACDTLVLGVRPADLGNAVAGSALEAVHVRSSTNTTTDADVRDRAPNADGVRFVVGTSNLAPVLDPIGDRVVAEGETLSFTVAAVDPNGDPVTYSASGLPQGASFDASTGRFTWPTTYGDAGRHAGVTFSATDGKATDMETIAITVGDVDTAPTLNPIGDRTVVEGQTLAFTVLATDADGDALTLAAEGLPAGAAFDAATGAFSWTPAIEAGHATRTVDVRFTATDGQSTAAEDVTLTVLDQNRAPVLAAIGNKAVAEGDALSFAVAATDADGDAVTVQATGLPAGATFDGAIFSWTTTFGDEGNHVVVFSATDGTLADQETVTISVGDVNRPPAIVAIPDQVVAEGQTLTLQVIASDPDGQALTYSSPNLPAGATLGAATGVLTWTPTNAQAGTYPNVQVVVSDGTDAATGTFAITVTDADVAPVLDPISTLTVLETATKTVTVRATDADGHAITYAVTGPAWVAFTDNGDGTGALVLSPPGYEEGTHAVTVRAHANGLFDEQAVDVVVRRKVDAALARVGAGNVAAAPRQALSLSAVVTNAGSQTDTFTVLTSGPAWANTPPGTVTLGPGESATLTWSVTVPANGGSGTFTLTARSQADASVARSTSWVVSTPVTVVVTFEKAPFSATDEVRGVLKATWADGSAYEGRAFRLEQTPRGVQPLLASSLASSVSGTTDANGEWAFAFLADAGSRAPGRHDVRAVSGVLVFTGMSYTVA